MAYFGYFMLWPVFYPMAFELSCIFYLTWLKIYFEIIAPRAETPTTADTSDLELNNSERAGRSATVQEEPKASISLQGSNGTAIGSDAGTPDKDAGGGEPGRAGAEQV